jgi:cysteinyl-tRNA synthetase
MVALSKDLVKKGYAYEKLRSLYFDISRFNAYGRLSGVDVDKIKLGATVDLDEYEKDNPRDFTLMKRAKLSELKRGLYTKTEWGNVRPSWHIQCAAMSMKYLGENYDIHTAGRELVFPHHENEIAIANAVTNKPLANYWLHCDRVLADGKKIDEQDPHLTLERLTAMGYSGKEIRYWLLATHYRKPVIYSETRLADAQSSLRRLTNCIHNLLQVKQGAPYPDLDQLLYDLKQGFINAMDDDLNISAAMASQFQVIKRINVLIRDGRIDPAGAAKIVAAFKNVDEVLNVYDFQDTTLDSEARELMAQRDQARKAGEWDLADRLRDQLQARGIVIMDKKL